MWQVYGFVQKKIVGIFLSEYASISLEYFFI